MLLETPAQPSMPYLFILSALACFAGTILRKSVQERMEVLQPLNLPPQA